MCRFCLYLGDVIEIADITTRPENSIIHQSYDAKYAQLGTHLNADGFGIGWFGKKKEPGRFRAISPAWNNPNLRNLSEHISSGCILAHVRLAPPGSSVIFVNNHPFMIDNILMMHNGGVGGFQVLKKKFIALLDESIYQQVEGTTDTEHLFALIMTYFNRSESSHWSWCERMEQAVKQAFSDVRDLMMQERIEKSCLLNIAISNGEHAVVTRFAINDPAPELSLYYRKCKRISLDKDQLTFLGHDPKDNNLFICSEPLDKNDKHWFEVKPNYILLSDKSKTLDIHPLVI
jgi:glutamine amidotransferase